MLNCAVIVRLLCGYYPVIVRLLCGVVPILYSVTKPKKGWLES